MSAIAGGFLAQAITRELIKFIPVFENAIATSLVSVYTQALGKAVCVYFGDLMRGKKPDPKNIPSAMQQSFQAAQERFKSPKQLENRT